MSESSRRSYRVASTEKNTFYPRMFGSRGAVAAEHYSSTLAGIEILRMGGNAVDAACAATLVEGVVNQQMHSIGGELPILISTPDSEDVVCINGNMAAPGKATPEAFFSLGHETIPAQGVLAAGVPGAFGAIIEAMIRLGTLRLADITARAIELAESGFPAHAGLIRQHRSGLAANVEKFRQWPGTAAVYLAGGDVPEEGALIRNPALAQMYRHLAQAERKAGGDRRAGLKAAFAEFYRGDIAAEIVSFVKERGGLLERSDFEAFEIPVETSASISYGGVKVHKCGPWTQGPALLQSLSILKNFDLHRLAHNSADYIHVLLEAMKLAFADREQFYADPRQVEIPLTALLSDDYGALRAALIGSEAVAALRPGDPRRGGALLPPSEHLGGAAWAPGTVHVTAMDAQGFTAAFTPSGGWLSASEMIPALGFPLSMRLSNCYLRPAHHPNLVAPFKRPRTTISPTLVMRDGKAVMAFGSMGGDQQDQWQLQFLLNRLVFDMPVQQAIEAPKFSSEHFPGSFAPHDFFLNRVRAEPEIGEETFAGLRARGHEIDLTPSWSEGFLCATERNLHSGMLEAGCDPRGTKSEIFPACALAI
jgi:gamma-glutamyltranspeptidase/glutathione hydrolase